MANIALHRSIFQAMETFPMPYNFTFVIIFACVSLVYLAAKSIYNIFFHPLKHVPGPKLAAATYLVEFYYDVILIGRYTTRIQQMHERYGTPQFTHMPFPTLRTKSRADSHIQVPSSASAPTKSTATTSTSPTRSTPAVTENEINHSTRLGLQERKQSIFQAVLPSMYIPCPMIHLQLTPLSPQHPTRTLLHHRPLPPPPPPHTPREILLEVSNQHL